jgi:ribosomal protein L11 methylase PrmA
MTSGNDVFILPSSFRNGSGFVFLKSGSIYRQINQIYKDDYDCLVHSGLYDNLVAGGLLIPHQEVDSECSGPAYKIIKPEPLSFISYPHEWCFSQLKDAASLTLKIQKAALEFGMTLKDTSAYNIQFFNGKPILIDTLSFERYKKGYPWAAYRQFCQHFLAPLALMSQTDIRLSQLLRIYVDGVPLDLANCLLPFKTRINFSLLAHIHFHALVQKHYENKSIKADIPVVGGLKRFNLTALIDNLESGIKKMHWHPGGTEWADYYGNTNYSGDAFEDKRRIVAEFLDKVDPKNVWDLGANTGIFSRLASQKGVPTVAFDMDPAAVERNYINCIKENNKALLPLVMDLTNPTSGFGWGNHERMSLIERGPADMALALALVHHLAISNNLPLQSIAEFFQKVCRWLIVEFVPKTDSQVQRLLASRQDVFPDYTKDAFKMGFCRYFEIQACANIKNSERTLYLFKRREI